MADNSENGPEYLAQGFQNHQGSTRDVSGWSVVDGHAIRPSSPAVFAGQAAAMHLATDRTFRLCFGAQGTREANENVNVRFITGKRFVEIKNVSTAHNLDKCNSARCATCPQIKIGNSVYSNTTNTTFKTGCKAGTNCKTKNVIYLINCNVCNMQYVGQTKQELRQRMSGHRSSIRGNKIFTPIYCHFRTTGHSPDSFSISVLEVVENINNMIEREDFWIKMLMAAHPWGLNEKITGYGNISNQEK